MLPTGTKDQKVALTFWTGTKYRFLSRTETIVDFGQPTKDGFSTSVKKAEFNYSPVNVYSQSNQTIQSQKVINRGTPRTSRVLTRLLVSSLHFLADTRADRVVLAAARKAEAVLFRRGPSVRRRGASDLVAPPLRDFTYNRVRTSFHSPMWFHHS
jgi:hypothetical protein